VLSGFLITWLLLKEYAASNSISLRNFYLRRVLRIFPAYYVFITFSFVADHVLHDRWSPGLIAAAYGYVMNYYNAVMGHPTTSIAHAWSLAVEEQFYLLWPAALVWLLPRGRKVVARALLATIALIALWRSYLFVVAGVGTPWVYNAFDCRFDNLAVGCLLAVLLTNETVAERSRALVSRPWVSLATCVVLVASRLGGSLYHYSVGFTVDAVIIAVLLVQVLWLSGHPLWSWLELKPVRYLGRISYPLYLYHIWGIDAGNHVAARAPLPAWVWGIVCSIVMASMSYYGIERPFLKLKTRFERV